MKEYFGTYKMTNGCFLKVFKTENGLIDSNNIAINNEELNEFKRID